jgi:predicted proteasome-type protease
MSSTPPTAKLTTREVVNVVVVEFNAVLKSALSCQPPSNMLIFEDTYFPVYAILATVT